MEKYNYDNYTLELCFLEYFLWRYVCREKKVSKKALGMNKHFIFNNPHPFNIAAILAYCHFCFLLFLLKTYLHNYVECNLSLRLFWGMRHLELHITIEDKAL